MKYLLFSIYFFCLGNYYSQTQTFIYPDMTQDKISINDSKEFLEFLFQKGIKICNTKLKGNVKFAIDSVEKPDPKIIYLMQGSDEYYIHFEALKETGFFCYISTFKQKDYFNLVTRDCPMGPCYTSYLYKKEKNTFKELNKLEGIVSFYSNTKETDIAIIDYIGSNLVLQGKLDKDKVKIKTLVPNLMHENKFKELKTEVNLKQNKKIIFLHAPDSNQIDSPLYEFNFTKKQKVEIISEKNEFVLIQFKPDNKMLQSLISSQKLIKPLIQKMDKLSDKEWLKLLNEKFYVLGWIQKKDID
jgi:hypothetical protein